ncbi:MAG: ribonuclease HI [Myxococcota bacterium]
MWQPAEFKGQKVWARVRDGALKVEEGRVEIRYSDRLGARIYRAGAGRVTLSNEPATELAEGELAPPTREPAATGRTSDRSAGSDSELVSDGPTASSIEGIARAFTDGASRGNPGPAGAGVRLEMTDGRVIREARFLGLTTNNVAELTAISMALELMAQEGLPRHAPAAVLTDSSYAIGVLTKGWKAKANVELVARIKEGLQERPRLSFHWVRGHVGTEGNEDADRLANRGADGDSFIERG